MLCTVKVKPETLALLNFGERPDSQNFDERNRQNADMICKGAYCVVL